jgi:Fe-S oxidoreductase/FAD/FMN-containing dehydrogenase
MNEGQKHQLEAIAGTELSFDRVERKLYSHDVGSVPGMVRPLMGTGIAGAVVRPGSERELQELISLAMVNNLEVVPRGAATSGYGGAVPHEGALVVDVRRMDRILALDEEALTVTVQAGALWRVIQEKLAKRGLTLALYPSSLPSSTVGGWLAQGGAGFGSFAHGWFKDVVVSARVLLPNSGIKVFEGDDLELVADAEGITGFITEVTFRVLPLAEEVVAAAAFERADDLQKVLEELRVRKEELKLWSVSFLNPPAIRLAKRLPRKLHHGHVVETVTESPELPEAYIMLCTWKETHAHERALLEKIVTGGGGSLLPDDVASHEWSLRYAPLRLKRIGPSVIPTEVVVPVGGLGATLEGIEERIKQPMVIEGMVVGGDEVVLLGFIPHDERTFGFNVAFGLSLSAIKVAAENGGRAYSTGIYFRRYAEEVLGKDRLNRLMSFKKEVDPHQLLNPGKVYGESALNSFMATAEALEHVVRAFANRFDTELEESFSGGKYGIPDDVATYAYACAQCGYCVDRCEEYSSRGWESHSPRGKWYFLREVLEGREKITQEWVTKFLICTTCEVCENTCPLDLPIEPSWLKLRGKLVNDDKMMTFPPFEMMAASLEKEGNIWASYRQDRSAWLPADLKDKLPDRADIAYFAGCTASYVEPDIGQGSVRLLEAAGIEFTYLGDEENCCGIPMLMAGKWDLWVENMKHNIAAAKAKGIKTVVASCPACHLVWKTYYRDWCAKLGIPYDIESVHYSEIVADKVRAGEIEFTREVPLTVTFHDSCHIGRASGVYEPPRDLLAAIPGIEMREMEHNREDGLCCGSVLTLIGEPPVAHKIGDTRLKEAVDIGVKDIVALCPCCEFQLRVSADRVGRDIRVHDLSHLVATALGHELDDPTPHALSMWAVFEKMVYLMEPAAMAALMEELYPQMLEAMPLGMGKMMRGMAKVPGALDAMKTLMPKLFPLLMPKIMPKVMPDMIEAVGNRIEMPEHMLEQMPDLLPKTMENLMPNMLPLLMPYVVPSLVAHLKNGAGGE